MVDSHATGRDRLDRAARRDLALLLNRALREWSSWLVVSSDDVRAEMTAALEANLGQRRSSRRPRRIAPMGPAQRENLRRRLLYVVNGTYARALNASPSAVRDGLLELLREDGELPAQRARPT